jgi:hypothetical protein
MQNHVCLYRGVWVAGATWQAAMRIVSGVGDLMQRTRHGQAQVRYSVAGRSGGQVMPCAVCTVHGETRSAGFLVEPQNHGRVSWLSLKNNVDGFSIWTSKPAALVW